MPPSFRRYTKLYCLVTEEARNLPEAAATSIMHYGVHLILEFGIGKYLAHWACSHSSIGYNYVVVYSLAFSLAHTRR